MKVFSKEKFLKSEGGRKSWNQLNEWGVPEKDRWPSICDGKTPEECKKLGWAICDDWCIEKWEGEMKEAVQKFMDEKLVIAFTSPNQIREFANMVVPFELKAVEKPAHEWMRENAEIFFDNAIFGTHPVVHLAYNFGRFKNRISWSSGDTIEDPHYLDRGWKVMSFDKFEKWGVLLHMGNDKRLKQEEKYKIEIVCDGDKVTVARMIINGVVVKVAEARRNPKDKFNFRIGAEYAFNRLFAKKTEHDGCDGCVWEHDDEEQCAARGCRNAFCYPENLKKPDKYAKKQDFKIGDRVICVKAKRKGGYESANGEHGRVIENRSAGTFVNWIAVEFDNLLHGAHDANGAGKEGHCFWIDPTTLEHE